MSDQEQEDPVWHAIVGEGWEPVPFGSETLETDEVLRSQGWVRFRGGGGFTYQVNMIPRRRRRKLYDIRVKKCGLTHCHINAAKPGDCFRLTEHGELVKMEVEQ